MIYLRLCLWNILSRIYPKIYTLASIYDMLLFHQQLNFLRNQTNNLLPTQPMMKSGKFSQHWIQRVTFQMHSLSKVRLKFRSQHKLFWPIAHAVLGNNNVTDNIIRKFTHVKHEKSPRTKNWSLSNTSIRKFLWWILPKITLRNKEIRLESQTEIL